MAYKINYNQQRNDRQRVKDQKKQEKLQRREADAERRRAERDKSGPDDNTASEPQRD